MKKTETECDHECLWPGHTRAQHLPLVLRVPPCCATCTICGRRIVIEKISEHRRDCHNQK